MLLIYLKIVEMKIPFKVSLLFLISISICAGKYYDEEIRMQNTVMSPFSLSVNLIALYFAGDERVRARIKRFLHLNGTNDEIGQRVRNALNRFQQKSAVKFLMLSNIYVSSRFPVSASYDSLIHKYLNMRALNINFSQHGEISKTINRWINQCTGKNIFVPVERPSDNTAFLMPNFIHIEADFRYPLSSLILQGTFLNDGISKRTITMMRNRHLRLKYNMIPELEAEVIEMPFSNSTISMMIVLPKNPQELPQLQRRLRDFNTFHLHKQLEFHYIDVSLPIINEFYTNYLEDHLINRRMYSIFGVGTFSKIAKHGSKIYLDGLVQTVSFKMNEEGIAPRSNLNRRTELNDSVMTLEVNHPFAFYIQDNEFIYMKGYIHKMN
ncbi:intracellular coagulation inhibitor 3-like isoform X1 [Drosophila willistoni]|uniref:intracellular coagulation inhibitor 3-like isoform X1 n=1 Tax=Drosophila willistoni TaxID=7260 RepID=UPI001F0736D0|nr:intracellular coagulation inhibitor 3-like isoform X1 [Drosophila willistoni]